MKRFFSVFGRDQREFKVSLWFFWVSGFFWSVLVPIPGVDMHYRFSDIQTREDFRALRAAGLIIINVIALLLSINAVRDENLPLRQRVWVKRWMTLLLIWLAYLLWNFWLWWDRFPEFLRPSSFQS